MKNMLVLLALTAAFSLAACKSDDPNGDNHGYANPFTHPVDATPKNIPNLQPNPGTSSVKTLDVSKN